jgi:hypothetical protein
VRQGKKWTMGIKMARRLYEGWVEDFKEMVPVGEKGDWKKPANKAGARRSQRPQRTNLQNNCWELAAIYSEELMIWCRALILDFNHPSLTYKTSHDFIGCAIFK